MKDFKIAVCQTKPLRKLDECLASVERFVSEAKDNGSELVLLPEIFHYPYELGKIPKVADKDGAILDSMKVMAKKYSIYICSGSIATQDGDKRFNRSYFISPKGELLGQYDKCHMFDVEFEELRTRESRVFDKGNDFCIVDCELGKIGILICYDIRFPEMARKLALMGAEVILVPAAFNNVTGPLHWDLLFRTRAVENQLYLAVSSPALDESSSYKAYGHSMIVDPMGIKLGEAETEETIIYADLKHKVLDISRNRLPLLKHRRPELY